MRLLATQPPLVLLLCCSLCLTLPAQTLQQVLQNRDPQQRVAQLGQVLQRQPSNDAYFHRAMAWLELRNPDRALADLRAGQSAKGSIPQASFQAATGYALFLQGKYREGAAAAQQALAQSPDFGFGLQVLAQNQMGLNENEASLATLERLAAADPQNPNADYLRAAAQMNLGRNEAALRSLAAAQRAQPGNPDIVHRRLVVLDRLGRHAEAAALADTLVAQAPADPAALTTTGKVLSGQGAYTAAVGHFTKAVTLLSTRLAQEAEAARAQQAPLLHNAYLQRGDAYLSLRRYRQALADYVQASRVLPDDAAAHLRIGGLQTVQQNWREAAEAFETAYRLNPRLPDGWVNLGFAYSNLGQNDAAIRAYTRGLSVPNVADRGLLLNNRGFAYLEQNNLPAAYADLTAAVAAAPRLAMARVSLGEYYLVRNQWAEAKAQFDAALRMPELDSRERWSAHYRRAVALRALNQPTQALVDVQAAITADPQYAEAYELLGFLHHDLADHCAARAALQQAFRHPQRMDPASKRTDAATLLNRLDAMQLRCP